MKYIRKNLPSTRGDRQYPKGDRRYRHKLNHLRNTFIISLSLAALLPGCVAPASDLVISVPGNPNYIQAPPWQRYLAGVSFENRPIECMVIGAGSDVIFILGAIHGNEQAGIALCRRLFAYLQQNPELLQGRKVVLMPTANPDGVAHNQRYNARGIDLNRNFEAANRQNTARYGMAALSEPESRVIKEVIRRHAPGRIVTLHEPLNCIDYDGPGQALAERMGKYCELPVRKLGANPGSLGSYAGLTLGIPIITIEFPQGSGALDGDLLWTKYGRMLLAAVAHPGRL